MNHTNTLARVMALDLATVTGWATLANGVITSGSWSFARHHGNKNRAPDHPGAPFAMFRRWLHTKLQEDKPAGIAYEEVMQFKFGLQAHSFCGLRGILFETAAASNLPLYPCHITSVKKFWTGSGKSKKPEMMAETLRRYPELELTDDNESDALALLNFHLDRTT